MGVTLGTVSRALFSGEACPESLRQWFKDRGVATYQVYATADLGLLAYETEALEGMVIDEGVILEIVRPGTGDPVPEGEVGELVVTSLNPDYPLIRFDRGFVHEVAKRHMVGRLGNVIAYLAGPPPAVDASIRMLLLSRVTADNIRYDKFS